MAGGFERVKYYPVFQLKTGHSFFYAKIKVMSTKFSTTDYRYPYEYLILVITIVIVLLVIALTAAATVCSSAIFVPLVVIAGYYTGRNRHRELLSQAQQVTPSINTRDAPPHSS